MNSPVGREADGTPAVPDLDTSRPHAARIYDYYLGGKNHFAADRETADKVLEVWPHIRVAAREQRLEFVLMLDDRDHLGLRKLALAFSGERR